VSTPIKPDWFAAIEPNWTAYAAALDAMTAAEVEAERQHWREILRVIERLPAAAQVGHSMAVGKLRLAERALTKAKQDAR